MLRKKIKNIYIFYPKKFVDRKTNVVSLHQSHDFWCKDTTNLNLNANR